jgi:DNA-binding NtrC family response regulator
MIVIIDDEPIVRGWVARTLRAARYDVRDFQHVHEAIGALLTESVDLVIQDYVMHLGGEDLFWRIKSMLPAVPVICLSGQPSDFIRHVPFDAILEKPCGARELVETVRRLVAPPRSAP